MSYESILERLQAIFPDKNINEYIYSPMKGIYRSHINMITDHIRVVSKIYFNILNKHKIQYAVFAGQSVGLCRNAKNIPWIDDYDMIIFAKDIDFFENTIISDLTSMGFVCSPYYSSVRKSGYHVQSQTVKEAKEHKHKYFHIDIFYSDFVNDKLVNIGDWGFYHKKIPRDYVLPFQYKKIDDLVLPFFNRPDMEVKLTYGDIYIKCVIYTHAHNNRITYDNWMKCYDDFNKIREKSIENTKKKIYINQSYTMQNILNLRDHKFTDEIDLLKYISVNNIGYVYIFDVNHVKLFSASIKYYYPKVIITHITNNYNPNVLLYLSYIDKLCVKSQDILDKYKDKSFMFPTVNISLTKLITFGTFDLFHHGHDNIFNKCNIYSENIIVGLSTDEFTFAKKNIYPHDNYELRKNNVLKQNGVIEVFPEESMELKESYIDKYKPDIFVMGGDWKGKFDWVKACVIYFERTPNISSTMLRNELRQKNYII